LNCHTEAQVKDVKLVALAKASMMIWKFMENFMRPS